MTSVSWLWVPCFPDRTGMPNGREQSYPAEAGRHTMIASLAGEPGKQPERSSPPGKS